MGLETRLETETKSGDSITAIHSEISQEQCLKRMPELVRSRTVLLRLGHDNSCPTIGLQ